MHHFVFWKAIFGHLRLHNDCGAIVASSRGERSDFDTKRLEIDLNVDPMKGEKRVGSGSSIIKTLIEVYQIDPILSSSSTRSTFRSISKFLV